MSFIRLIGIVVSLLGITGALYPQISVASIASSRIFLLTDLNTIAQNAYTKATSPVWQGFQAWRGGTRINGESGSKKRYYEWDNTHGDVEVYDSNGIHLGCIDAGTGAVTKSPVKGRKITI